MHRRTETRVCIKLVKRPLSKRPKNGFQDQLSLNAGQKYCRMLQREHSAILSTFIKLLFVINFEWPFYTGFTVKSFIPKGGYRMMTPTYFLAHMS